MKAYIGNRIVCLAQLEEREDLAGYTVLYVDGSETWLTKEVFEFEFRLLDEAEIQMIISTIIETDISEEDFNSMFAVDGEGDSEEDPILVLDEVHSTTNYEIVEDAK